MAFEQPGTSSEHFPMWLERIYIDNSYEVIENLSTPFLLLPQRLRLQIWKMSSKMLGENCYKGLAGHACIVLERYWAAYIERSTHLPLDSSQWQLAKRELLNKTVLLSAVCIQLVTKMDSTWTDVSPQVIQRTLKSMGRYYVLREIIDAENEVMKGIGFRISLWTNVDKVLMMANELGFPPKLLEGASLLMDMTDCYRPIVQENLNTLASDSTSTSSDSEFVEVEFDSDSDPGPSTSRTNHNTGHRSKILNMHLVAGAVVATVKYFRYEGPDPTAKVARWIHVSSSYIDCISDIILNKVINVKLKEMEEDDDPYEVKRQRTC